MTKSLLSSFALFALTIGCASTSPHTLPPVAPKAQTSGPPPLSPSGEYGDAKFDVSKATPAAKTMPRVKSVKKTKSAEPVVIKAEVAEVCPKKGCWMNVKGKDGDLRVTFKDYGFFVPTELKGREVALEGHYVVHTETVAEQKHLLEDARRPRSEIDAVKKDRETLRFVATGVRDLDAEKKAP